MKIGDKFRYINSSIKENIKYDRVISDFIYANDGTILHKVKSESGVFYSINEIEVEPVQLLRDEKLSNLLNGYR